MKIRCFVGEVVNLIGSALLSIVSS